MRSLTRSSLRRTGFPSSRAALSGCHPKWGTFCNIAVKLLTYSGKTTVKSFSSGNGFKFIPAELSFGTIFTTMLLFLVLFERELLAALESTA